MTDRITKNVYRDGDNTDERHRQVCEDIGQARSFVVITIQPDGSASTHGLFADYNDIEDMGELYDDVHLDMVMVG